jgi:putative ABC transport system permease protein
MFRALLASLRTHRVRLAMTALAVALGTGLMCGSFVFTASLTHSLDSLFARASAGIDVEVRHSPPPGAVQGAGSAATQPVPASLLTAIRRLPGVSAADGTISGRAVLLRRNGTPLPAPFVVALSWPASTPFQSVFTGRQGRPPAGPGQVMIDRNSAHVGHFAVGDRIEVAIGGKATPFTISGITGYGSAASIGGGSMAIFSLPTAQRLFGQAGRYDTIDVKAVPGVTPQHLRGQVAAILPAGVEAVTAASASASEAHQLNSQLGVLTTFFAAFAGVAMFVGAFVIWNTFSIMIGQRSRELALLRALGAGRGQVFRSVLAEAAAVGAGGVLAGAVLGVAVAKGLAALLGVFGPGLRGRAGDHAGRRVHPGLPGHQGGARPGAPGRGAQPAGVLGPAAGGWPAPHRRGCRRAAGRPGRRGGPRDHRRGRSAVLHRCDGDRTVAGQAARRGGGLAAHPAARPGRSAGA